MNLKCPGQIDTGCCSVKRKEAEVAELSFVLGASPDKRAQIPPPPRKFTTSNDDFSLFSLSRHYTRPGVWPFNVRREMTMTIWCGVCHTRSTVRMRPKSDFSSLYNFEEQKKNYFSAQSVSVSIESNWRRENCIISIHSAELKIARKNKLYVSEHLTADIISTSSFHSTLLLCAAEKKVKKERRCVWWTYVYTRMSDDDRIDSVHCTICTGELRITKLNNP